MIYSFCDGDISRESIVITKDVDDFYLWLAMKNLGQAKEKYLLDNKRNGR